MAEHIMLDPPKNFAPAEIARRFKVGLRRLQRDVATAIEVYMVVHGAKVQKSELAARLDVSPSRVSQMLSGDENLTLRSLAGIAAALDAHIKIELVPNDPGPDTRPTHGQEAKVAGSSSA